MLGVSLGTGRRQGAPNEQPNVLLSRVEAEAVLTSPCFWSVLGCPQSDQGQIFVPQYTSGQACDIERCKALYLWGALNSEAPI